MANKIDALKKDAERLKKTIAWLEAKLEEIDSGQNQDPSQASKFIKEKDEAEKLLQSKEKEIKIEKENSKEKLFGGVSLNAGEIARLSVGGSLKTSMLDKTAINDDKKKKVIDDIYKAEPDEKKRAQMLLEEGLIVQRKM